MHTKTPVLLIFFNREEEPLQVIDAVRKYAPEKMYLASDGGRNEKEQQKVAKIRERVKESIDWDCQLECRFSDKNLGCQWGPVSAVDWVFEKEDRCIILEDDCVPDASFFPYCEELLERYADDGRVWMVSGGNYVDDDTPFEGADYLFSLRTDTWGWATWKRAWERCDFRLRSWPVYKKEKVLSHTYYMKYYDELAYMTEQLDRIYRQKDRSIWDYQWRFHMIINNGLCIMPRKKLIHNIGWGKTATHTKEKIEAYDAPAEEMTFPLRHPSCVAANADYDRRRGELLFRNQLGSGRDRKKTGELLQAVGRHLAWRIENCKS